MPHAPDRPPTRGSRRRWLIGAVTAIAVGLVALVGLGAFDDDDGPSPSSPTAEPTTPVGPENEVTTPSGEATNDPAVNPAVPSTASGTDVESTIDADASAPGPSTPAPVDPSSPASAALPLGTTAPIGDRYAVAMTAVDLDATELILAEDPSNPTPPPGDTYVMITLDVRFNGLVGEAEPYFDLRVGAVDDAGREFEDVDCVALAPDDMYGLAPLGPGEAATGTFCLVVPAEVTDTLTFFVEENVSSADSRVWWSSRN